MNRRGEIVEKAAQSDVDLLSDAVLENPYQAYATLRGTWPTACGSFEKMGEGSSWLTSVHSRKNVQWSPCRAF